MAKRGKSKILASMLAVSTMAVFYTAPVMAADLSVDVGTSGNLNTSIYFEMPGPIPDINLPVLPVTGTFTVAGSDIATALNGTNLTLNSVTANTISTTGNTFTVDAKGDVIANSVTTSGDVITASYSLNTVGANTAGITKSGSVTTVEGVAFAKGRMDADYVLTDGLKVNGLSELDGVKVQNGSVYANNASYIGGVQFNEGSVRGHRFSITDNTFTLYNGSDSWKTFEVNSDQGTVMAANGNFNIDAYGNVKLAENATVDGVDVSTLSTAATDISELQNKTQNMSATEGNTTFTGSVNVGDTRITSGGITTDVVSANEVQVGNTLIQNETISTGNVFSTNYNLEQVGANLGNLQDDFNTTNANVGGIIRDAAEGAAPGEGTTTIEGSTSFDANGVNVGNGAVIANTDGSFSAANGAFGVDTDGNVTANKVTVGDTIVTGSSITTDVIQADEAQIGGTFIQNGVVNADNVFSANYNLEEVGDDLGRLQDNFDTTNANVAGIKRTGSEEDGWTTTIEDTLSVSDDQVLAQTGSSQLVLNEDVAGLSSGNASFALTNNELQLSVAGNGMTVNQFGTTLNGAVNFTGHDGNSYTLSDLEGRVYDLEQKTQNITSSEPGQGGEGSTVPPTTDGHTGVEGDVTVGGDLNVNGSVNVGDTIIKDDGINVGEGTHIGDGVVSSTNGNFDNINANKATIGKTTISDDGTVTTDKVVTGNTTLDNEGLNVGGKTSVTADGVNVGGAEGTSIKHDEISVGDGGYIGGGDVVSGEGVSLNQTAERVGSLENRVGELEDRIDKVGAMAAAIANLRSMGYDPAAPTEVAVGIGQYRDETGAALGLFHYPNRDFMLSLSVSTSGDEVMGGIGATWKFGRKSPEKVAEIKKAQKEADVRRAEAQKLEKAEAMKQAAKEAKIKAQQERHAKLAAERAAQAEAAK